MPKHITQCTKDHPQVAAAIDFTVRNNLMIPNCIAVRVARGARKLGTYDGADGSLVLW